MAAAGPPVLPAAWCVDFEFQQPAGERPRPVCLVAKEFFTSETIRMWRDELHALHRALSTSVAMP